MAKYVLDSRTAILARLQDWQDGAQRSFRWMPLTGAFFGFGLSLVFASILTAMAGFVLMVTMIAVAGRAEGRLALRAVAFEVAEHVSESNARAAARFDAAKKRYKKWVWANYGSVVLFLIILSPADNAIPFFISLLLLALIALLGALIETKANAAARALADVVTEIVAEESTESLESLVNFTVYTNTDDADGNYVNDEGQTVAFPDADGVYRQK